MRNSWGQHWGEAGHLKLDKSLNDGGAVLGTSVDGIINLDIYENHFDRRQVVELLISRNERERNQQRWGC